MEKRRRERWKAMKAKRLRREGVRGLRVKGERSKDLQRRNMAVEWIDSHIKNPRNRFFTIVSPFSTSAARDIFLF